MSDHFHTPMRSAGTSGSRPAFERAALGQPADDVRRVAGAHAGLRAEYTRTKAISPLLRSDFAQSYRPADAARRPHGQHRSQRRKTCPPTECWNAATATCAREGRQHARQACDAHGPLAGPRDDPRAVARRAGHRRGAATPGGCRDDAGTESATQRSGQAAGRRPRREAHSRSSRGRVGPFESCGALNRAPPTLPARMCLLPGADGTPGGDVLALRRRLGLGRGAAHGAAGDRGHVRAHRRDARCGDCRRHRGSPPAGRRRRAEMSRPER
jgi:hypothetical protein